MIIVRYFHVDDDGQQLLYSLKIHLPRKIGEIIVRIRAVAGCGCDGWREWFIQLVFFRWCIRTGFIGGDIEVASKRSNVADATFSFSSRLNRLFDKHMIDAPRACYFVVLLHGFDALIASL